VDPSHIPPIRAGVPDVSLRLEYAYGYRSQEMRNSVRYNSEGNVVYICSTLGITLNRVSKVQNFFQHHTDAIISFACSSDGSLAASGQLGMCPFVTVWDTCSCAVVTSLSEIHVNGIGALKFNPDNTLLATISLDELHTISVYNWRSDCLISRAFGGSNRLGLELESGLEIEWANTNYNSSPIAYLHPYLDPNLDHNPNPNLNPNLNPNRNPIESTTYVSLPIVSL
jgi:WD40 repeat protein